MTINFSIKEGLIGAFEGGVGYIAACAYGASPSQAVVFPSVNMLVSRILKCLISSYLQNTRQLFLADIVILATSGLAGVLATRLFCEKTIKWKRALASSVISYIAVLKVCSLLMKPMPLKPLQT